MYNLNEVVKINAKYNIQSSELTFYQYNIIEYNIFAENLALLLFNDQTGPNLCFIDS